MYTVNNLVTGLPYRFKVVAWNINGASDDSDITTIYACLKPSNVLTPYKIQTTKTSVTIGWYEPLSNGCPITGFEILRDTGNYDALTTSVDPTDVMSKPSLRQYTITSLAPTSATFRFKIRAFNAAGQTDSSPLNAVLSAVPDTPSSGPISDSSVTDNTEIKVSYGPQPST